MRHILLIVFVLNSGCYSLHDIYSRADEQVEIEKFCDNVMRNNNMKKTNIAYTNCVVESTKVNRDVKYERWAWILYAVFSGSYIVGATIAGIAVVVSR